MRSIWKQWTYLDPKRRTISRLLWWYWIEAHWGSLHKHVCCRFHLPCWRRQVQAMINGASPDERLRLLKANSWALTRRILPK